MSHGNVRFVYTTKKAAIEVLVREYNEYGVGPRPVETW